MFSAVLQFNDGGSGIIEVFRKLGVRPGKYMRCGLSKAVTSRICLADRKSSDFQKLARKKLSAKKKGYADITYEKEGDVYFSGGFS